MDAVFIESKVLPFIGRNSPSLVFLKPVANFEVNKLTCE